MDWLRQNQVVCPDCRVQIGNWSAAGTLQVVSGLGGVAGCVHRGDPTAKGIQCPRLAEAVAEAKRSVDHPRRE